MVFIIALIMTFLTIPSPLFAGDDSPSAGRIINVKGEARIKKVNTHSWEIPSIGQKLQNGDELMSGEGGRIHLLLADESLLQINEKSRLIIRQVAPTAGWIRKKFTPVAYGHIKSIYQLMTGEIWLRNKNLSPSVEIQTENMVIGIRGTELNLLIDNEQTTILTILRGVVQVWNQMETVKLRKGEAVIARSGQPLEKRVLLRPQDSVQWTLYLPDIFDIKGVAPCAGTEGDCRKQANYLEKAYLQLTTGHVREGHAALLTLTRENPQFGLAWSVLALSQLLQSNKSDALSSALNGVKLSPDSATAQVVLSYAHQAGFNLDAALDAISRAIRIDPQNATAHLLKARLLFGRDESEKAMRAIETARAIAPQNGEVHSLKGYLLLALNRTGEAIDTFNRAITLTSSNGEPHLGLALAFMRQDRVEEALESITAAVLLEPQRSIFQSYWAKMLYQIKRFNHAQDLLDSAQELDPRDPTPFLYRAYILYDLNREIEALENLNMASRLNDNRAVYRSRYLLDRDLAVTNVNQSLIFTGLGLAEWARNKALASVKNDYNNSAGHIFLGNAYFAMDDRMRAGTSETLLGNILQPANVNAMNTFQNYTSFFEQQSINAILEAHGGDHRTVGGSALVYGNHPPASLAFNLYGHAHGTNGWRDNGGYQENGTAASVKWDPSAKDGIYTYVSLLHSDQYDPTVAPYQYDSARHPDDRLKSDLNTAILGYYHRFSPDDLFLFNFRHARSAIDTKQSARTSWDDFVAFDQFVYDSRVPIYQVQGQFSHRWKNHQLILGSLQSWEEKTVSGYQNTDYCYNYYGDLYFLFNSSETYCNETRDRFQSYYLQDAWKINVHWLLEAAIYYDVMTNSNVFSKTEWDLAEWNPRGALVWTPNTTDTFRLAAFRYMVPFIVGRLDPTDIGGIPLLRNTYNGSLTEEIDFAWEHDFGKGFCSLNGFYAESTARDKAADGNETDWPSRLKGFDAAWNQIFLGQFGFRAYYRYLDVYNSFRPGNDRRDHLAKVSLKYFHPSGLYGGIAQSQRYQDMKNDPAKDEQLWLTDIGIGYKFPNKRGQLDLLLLNIFDSHFNWIVDDFVFTGRNPARELLLKLSLYF
jgi:tetratricopeptide (TPR) repeat protein